MKILGMGLLLFLCIIAGLGHSIIVVNSQEATDAASAVFYGNVMGEDVYMLIPGYDMAGSISFIPTYTPVNLVESPSSPAFAGVQSALQARGNSITAVSMTGTALNLELAKRSGARKFIISDPVYGYNVVSTIAYAKATRSYMIFADKDNIYEVYSFLSSNGADSILIYGQVDGEVSQRISELGISTEEINNGDKYDDNTELLDKYLRLNPGEDALIFSDGSFLQPAINSGDAPVMLVSQLIPDRSYNYLLNKVSGGTITSATLIGGDFVDPVYDLMRRINANFPEKKFSVFVMFGQGSSAGGQAENLRIFPLPYPSAEVSLDSASYNPSIGAFEVVYSNRGNAPAYVRSNIVVMLDGQPAGTIGDEDQYIIGRGQSMGVRYPFGNPGEGQLAINDTTYYGLSKYSFDKGFVQYMDVGRISFVDNSQVSIRDASYSPLEDKLSLRVKNDGAEGAFYRISVSYVDDEGLTVYEDQQVRNLSSGRSEIIVLGGVIGLPADKAGGATMNATVSYGARQAFLDKRAYAPVQMESFPWWVLLIVLILLLALIYIYLRGRKRKKEEEPEAQEVKKAAKKSK